MRDVITLAQQLISRRSVTPQDSGCQQLIADRLRAIGFECETLQYEDVTNLWAVHGQTGPIFCFAGHTDVVPAGPLDKWSSDPFTPKIRDGRLIGRGAADMKGSVAAMICATERFVAQHPTHPGQIALLLTSDEEGPAKHGTRQVMATLQERGIAIDYCLIGEPSSSVRLGDVARIGRRGSLNATLVIRGIQGHVAFPEKARNPIHLAMPALTALCTEVWDTGNEYFPATTFQISNIHGGTGVTNVIPGDLTVTCNFRFSTAVTDSELIARTEALLKQYRLDVEIDWDLSGPPFLSTPGKLTSAVVAALSRRLNVDVELSTGGGTSDGRFIAPTGTEVIELGPLNATIHQIDEQVATQDLEDLEEVYLDILKRVLGAGLKPV